jgi:hypothetical protein
MFLLCLFPLWLLTGLSTSRWLTSAEGIRKHGSVRRAATNLRRRITLHRSISNTFTDRMNRQARPKPFFPKVKPHAPDTIQTPYKGLPWSGRVKARIWAFGDFFLP